MVRWTVAFLLVACGGGGGTPDPCERAFAKLAQLGVFGGDTYGTEGALAIGLGCKDLTKDDLACIDKAKGPEDLDACKHASQVAAAETDLLHSGVSGGKPADPAATIAWSDATCACKDVACLVGVAERQRDQIHQILKSSSPDDPKALAAVDKMRDCVAKLGHASPAASGATPSQYKMKNNGSDPELARQQAIEAAWDAGVLKRFDSASPVDAEREQLREIADDAFTRWATNHMGVACPSSISDLDVDITKDVWGHERAWFCGASGPPELHGGFGVMSAGPDGQRGTDDDIMSWK